MTDRQLRKASRPDLLQLLLEEKRSNEALRAQLEQLQLQLESRQMRMNQAEIGRAHV